MRVYMHVCMYVWYSYSIVFIRSGRHMSW